MLNPIKKARMIAGITQYELADRIGVSTVAVSHWESGKCKPSVKRLRAVAETLGISVEDIVDQEGRAV